MAKKALVTGSTGFLGATLVSILNARKIEVIGLRRKTSPDDAIEGLKLTFAVGDILDPDSLVPAMKGVDWVFHVAAVADYYSTPKEAIYRVNVEGARNVFEAALKARVKRLVYTSSTAALGFPTPARPILDEADRFQDTSDDSPLGHYSLSKIQAEALLAEYVQKGLDAVTVLPAAVIGPRDLKFNAGALIVQALKPSLPVFPLPPGGANFIDVRDCAEGHVAAAEKGKKGERYVLSGHNMTLREMAQTTNQVLGTSVPVITIPRWAVGPAAEIIGVLRKLGLDLPADKGRVLHSRERIYYDNSKAVRELGLKVRPFAESVRDAYNWYVENDYLQKRGIRVAAKTARA